MAESTAHARPPVRVRFDRFDLDEANASLLCDGKPVTLPPTPFAVLCALARHPGALLTKNALLDEVWGHQFVSESVLKTVVLKLRAVLQDDARKPRFIETVSRRGYRFIAPIVTVTSSPARPGAPVVAKPFIGREEALSRLRGAWERACGGQRTIAWVAGEPGIGKTTLVERFIAELGDVTCVRGQCVEQYGAGEPYLPVLEALSELCRRDAQLPSRLRTVAPTWLLQLPWLSTVEERNALRAELVGVSAERMLREMGELLDRDSEDRPLLLVTEDLHWSDRATVQLIEYIARRRGVGRLLWLATFRLAEVVALDHPVNRLRRELRLHGLCEEIVLDPFSEREVAAYVAQHLPRMGRDEAFVRALHGRTDGLPLFIAAVATELLERAPDEKDVARVQIEDVAVPEGLSAIIDQYIAKLGSEERQVLTAAAVCGVEFGAPIVAHALDREGAEVAQVCDTLAGHHVWLAPPRSHDSSATQHATHSFRHALFRQVLLDRTLPSERARLHASIGAALEQQRGSGEATSAAELAMHFERGGKAMPALRYYAEAAEAALQHFSPSECVELTEQGLALVARAAAGPERDALEFTLATLRGISATQLLGVTLEAKAAFQRAYALLDAVPEHPMRVRLLYGFGFMLSLRADYSDALEVARRAEELAAATNDPVLVLAACIVHAEVDQLQGRWRVAREWIERGLELVEPIDKVSGEPFVSDPKVTLLAALAVPLLYLGFVDDARTALARAHERATSLAQPMTRLVALWHDALLEVRLGNTERVAALAGEMRTLVDEYALAHGRNACRWFGGWAEARMGRPLEGCLEVRAAHDDNARLGMLAGGSETLGYAAEALLAAGDLDAAESALREALEHAEHHGERVYTPQLFRIEARLARARGDSSAAAASLAHGLAEARSLESPWLEKAVKKAKTSSARG